MKKLKSVLLALVIIFVCGFAGLLIARPVLFNVLRYRAPDANTYKIFPQSVSQKSDTIFNFIRPALQRNDLDSLHVRNAADSLITLTEYLKQGKINLFLVIRNDSILYERYSKGYSDTTLTTLFSIAKTMLSVAVGKALEEGIFRGLDDKLTDYIPELKPNRAYAQITLRHLLQMKSGLDFKGTEGGIINALFSDEAKYYYSADMKKELLGVKLVNAPGTVWKYKSIDAILLGWALQNAAGKTVAQYFGEKIWSKIGSAHAATWGLDRAGLANTASRFQATGADMAKLGKLFLQHGRFSGKQVLSENWIAASTGAVNEKSSFAKGWQRSTNHYLWWIPQEGENGDFSAEGMRGQRLYIDPLTNTIIVQFAGKGSGNYPYRQISRYLAGHYFKYPIN